ncbi:MAG: GspE/PulE family protein, partial [Planctomycetota bacterium]
RDTTDLRRSVIAMIALGTAMRASDIHLAPHTVEGEGGVKVFLRYRIDGALHAATTLDARLLPALVEEWKRLAACDVHENVKPQDGRITIDVSEFNKTFPKKTVDLWVNFLRTSLGESVTARILDRQTMSFDLDRIDYASRDRERLLQALDLPWGLIMITGPVGCGKTTVLYSCLSRLADSSLKCLSIEDPVEYNLPWVSQVHVRRQAGLTYQVAARAILRSDPDVIMVGEARDSEILSLAQAAAVTGHLVFTTLHTDTAAGALKRMVDMGSDPFLVADSTKLILAQRLVRKLCPKCAVRCEPEPVLLASASEAARNGGVNPSALKKHFRKAVGCPHCSQTGYRGRTVVAEVLEVNGEIGKALRSGASVEQLEEIAVGQGMTTTAADAFRRAAAGETTVEEIVAALSLPSAMRPALHTTD